MGVKLGNGKWAIKEDKLLAYNDNSGRFFNKEFDFSRGSSATYVAKDGLIKTAGLQETNLVNNGDFSELGSELVVNGNFATDSDWSKFNGATISDGKANIIGDGSSFTFIQQSNVFEVGKYYKITVDVIINSGLGLKFQDGLTNENFGFALTTGSYTFYGVANSPNFTIGRRTGGTAFDSYVNNISVKQVDPNDYWTLGTGWSIEDNKAVFTSGTSGILFQSNIVETGKLYKLTFDVIRTSGFITSVFLGGVSDNTDINESGRYTYYITSINQDVLGFNADSTFNGSVSNISVQEIQTDTPRIDFSDSVKGALLLEPSSTQLLQYSEDFTQSIWTNARSSGATNQIIAPDGTTTGYKLIDSTDNNTHLLYSTQTVTTSSVFAFSVFLKKGSLNNAFIAFDSGINQSVVFDLQNGTIVSTGSAVTSSKIESFDNDWYRCSFTHTPTNTARLYRVGTYNGNISYAGSGSDFVYVWGAQLEQKSFATSYIPNYGVSGGVTRLADVCNNSGSAQDFSKEGVLYADISALSDDQTNRRITISDGTNTNRVVMGYNTNSNQIFYFVVVGNSTVASGSYTSSDITQFSKVAIKFKANDFALWVDGVERHTDTSGIIFSENTLTSLQFEQGSGNSLFFYGKVRELQVFTEALTDEQLEKLTTI